MAGTGDNRTWIFDSDLPSVSSVNLEDDNSFSTKFSRSWWIWWDNIDEKSLETIKSCMVGKHSSPFLNGWREKSRLYYTLNSFCSYTKQFWALLWTCISAGISPPPESATRPSPCKHHPLFFLGGCISNHWKHAYCQGKALIIQPPSQYREVIHYWVQSKVKNIKLQPLSKMVTGMVVMTQSEYIAHRKQGQEYSRPDKGCRVKVRNKQLKVQRYMWNNMLQLD